MTTTTIRTSTGWDWTESFLAGTLATVTLFVLLVLLILGLTGGARGTDWITPAPNPQPQVAPPRPGQPAAPSGLDGDGHPVPNPQPQVSPQHGR